jgi:RhtB (resistance to homoserine/threonine) family protein
VELFNLNEFLLLATAMLIALISPGPDFAMIVKQSISYGRRASVVSSLGIGLGISVHVIYTLLGIGLIISKSIVLFTVIKVLGAGYLIYLGYKSLRSNGIQMKDDTIVMEDSMSDKRAFMVGFLCNALNPKATLFFLSIFTVVISIETPLYIQAIYGMFCMIATTLWFVFLSLILSQNRVRNFFNRFSKGFDKAVGVVLISLGIKVALSKG